MNKDNCKVGQNVAYFPSKTSGEVEFGVVTELRDKCAMVRYEGDNISKSTYYSDLEVEPETLAPIGNRNENN
jgi:hypothetical protein